MKHKFCLCTFHNLENFKNLYIGKSESAKFSYKTQIVYSIKRSCELIWQPFLHLLLQESETADGVRIDNGVAVADLLDLESELHNIEQGYNQLQNIPAFAEDSWPASDILTNVQPSAPFLPSSVGTVAPLPPPPVSSFAQKNPSDPFDNSFNPRCLPIISPSGNIPLNASGVQQSSLSTQPMTALWSYTDAFTPPNSRPIAFSVCLFLYRYVDSMVVILECIISQFLRI